jgi:hypothetical protein
MLTHMCLACAHYLTRFAHLLDLQLTYVLPLTLHASVLLGQASHLVWIHFNGITNHQCPQSIMLGLAS